MWYWYNRGVNKGGGGSGRQFVSFPLRPSLVPRNVRGAGSRRVELRSGRKRRKKLASEASRGGDLGEAITRGQALHFEWRAKPAARERTSEERQGRRPSPFPLSSPPLGSPRSTVFSLFHPALSLFSRATKPGPKLLEEMQLNPKEDVLL